MNIAITCPDHGIVVEALLEGCVLAAQAIIDAGVVPPFPTDIPGLRFIPEQGTEKWLLPHQTMKAGGGDCEDLAIWTAGGYRATGLDPGARARVMQTGKSTLHCVVQLSDGTFEDPALVLRQRDKKRPGASAVLGAPHEVVVTDHRGGSTPAAWANAPAAAANPNATPYAGAALAKYMRDKGVKTLTVVPTATAFRKTYKVDEMFAPNAQRKALDSLVYELPSNPTSPEFGRAKAHGDGSDLLPYDDGQGGYYWGKASAADLAALDPYSGYGLDYGQDPYGLYGYGGYPFGPQQSLYDANAEWQYAYLASQPAYRNDDEGYEGYGSSAYDEPTSYADLYLDEEADDGGVVDDTAGVIDTTATEVVPESSPGDMDMQP